MSNTIPDTVLEQVSVIMQPQADSGLTEDFIIPIPTLSSATSPGIVYVSFTRDSPEEYVQASFQCILKFVSKEVDPSTGEPEEEGYEDEYSLEDTELAAGDYIVPSYVTFASEWDRMRGGVSVTETFSLPAMESLKGAYTLPSDCAYVGADDNLSCSGVQLRHRDPQHAASGRLRGAISADSAHVTTFRTCRRRRRQGTCPLPYDILEGAGCHARGRRTGGTAGGGGLGHRCHRWLVYGSPLCVVCE